MGDLKASLLSHSRYVADRTLARLEGLTDEEHRWSPVADRWHAGADADGRFFVDLVVLPPADPPFTTLAWRLVHLMGTYSDDRNARWLEVPSTGDPLQDPATPPVDAASAVALLARCAATWHGYLEAVTDEVLEAPLGAKAGGYAESTGLDFVLHQLDEQIHHGAEVALLRDLYRATVAAPRDPVQLAAMLGDELPADVLERLRGDAPDLLRTAASHGRWAGVLSLAAHGFEADDPGRASPLHRAAAAGRLDVIDALLAAGADATAVDPDFGMDPAGWARFFGHAAAVERLTRRQP